jgi:hypothetical protein
VDAFLDLFGDSGLIRSNRYFEVFFERHEAEVIAKAAATVAQPTHEPFRGARGVRLPSRWGGGGGMCERCGVPTPDDRACHEARDAAATPTSGSFAKAARQIDEKGNHEDQAERAAAKEGAAEIKTSSAEQEKEHD